MFEIADFARRSGTPLTCSPRAAFTTAETLVPEQVEVIAQQFHTKVYDQYASSEGAPFVVTCEHDRYHFLPSTGVLEVLSEGGEPADEGEAIVTSFTERP
jgi:phenylacetate-CoA ligase